MQATDYEFSREIIKPVRLRYLLYLPPGYEDSGDKRWPLVLFLHGSGERGDDIELVKKHGLPEALPELPDFPAIVVVPQCPTLSDWVRQLDALTSLLDHLEFSLPVDTDRIYLAGFSMGAHGTWMLAAHQPQRFAALIPIAGRTEPEQAPQIRHLPIWMFHGGKDEGVPISFSDQMYDALRLLDAQVQYTIYHDSGHMVAGFAFREAELYKWLFAQTRQKK